MNDVTCYSLCFYIVLSLFTEMNYTCYQQSVRCAKTKMSRNSRAREPQREEREREKERGTQAILHL